MRPFARRWARCGEAAEQRSRGGKLKGVGQAYGLCGEGNYVASSGLAALTSRGAAARGALVRGARSRPNLWLWAPKCPTKLAGSRLHQPRRKRRSRRCHANRNSAPSPQMHGKSKRRPGQRVLLLLFGMPHHGPHGKVWVTLQLMRNVHTTHGQRQAMRRNTSPKKQSTNTHTQ